MKESMIREGQWTTENEVLCRRCFSDDKRPLPKEEKAWRQAVGFRKLEPANSVTDCDRCGVPVQVRRPAAYAHNLVNALCQIGVEARMARVDFIKQGCALRLREPKGNGAFLVTKIVFEYVEEAHGGRWFGFYVDEDVPLATDYPELLFANMDGVTDWVKAHRDLFVERPQCA